MDEVGGEKGKAEGGRGAYKDEEGRWRHRQCDTGRQVALHTPARAFRTPPVRHGVSRPSGGRQGRCWAGPADRPRPRPSPAPLSLFKKKISSITSTVTT